MISLTKNYQLEVLKLVPNRLCNIYGTRGNESSVINGVEMNMGAKEISYGHYDNPEVYYAEFYNGEIYYEINAENLEEEEFINILRSLVS